ncbi:hypothetical protein MATL_G00181720 [Megalops atlanticus]|uniref:Shugoshin C-terminal domain-containing protein n=1 Tax=Megalops atlanticus TaxID=7932 RepID=A0A9D3T7A8_MEGAT|nr:hypothetical protein MATL_G00181720 [Megalops atlanticus]
MQSEGRVRLLSEAVDPKSMITVKKQAALKAAKQNSSIAAKIKTKIQNTSSFFKVSLKTNNKALALALMAQKEKSRQLETETVRLQKEIQALCFDLALRRYKHRQLVVILKDLQASTLKSMMTAIDLLSNNDDSSNPSEDTNEHTPTDTEDLSKELESRGIREAVPSEQSQQTVLKTVTRESSGSHTDHLTNSPEEIHSTAKQPGAKAATGSHMEAESSGSIQSPQKKSPRPSTGIQLHLENWSHIYSGPMLEADINPSVLAVNSHSTLEPPPGPYSVEPERQLDSPKAEASRDTTCYERTTLFNTEMEMTLGNSNAEIVTVETKPKKARKKNVAGQRKKDRDQTEDSCPPGKEKGKKSSTHRQEAQGADLDAAQGEMGFYGQEEEEDEDRGRDMDWFAPRRKTHFTSRNMKHHKHIRKVGASEVFAREHTLGEVYTNSPDHHHTNSGSIDLLEDDYFSRNGAQSSVFTGKEIPWDVENQDKKDPKGKSSKTSTVPTSQPYSSISRKTYVISEAQGRASTRARRTKASPVRAEDESAMEWHRGHAEQQTIEGTSESEAQRSPPQDLPSGVTSKRKGPLSEGHPGSSKHMRAATLEPVLNPEYTGGVITGDSLPWETSDSPSAPVEAAMPKKSRKESGNRVRKKERMQMDEPCSSVKERKKKSSSVLKEQDLNTDLFAFQEQSKSSGPASCSPTGKEQKEFRAEQSPGFKSKGLWESKVEAGDIPRVKSSHSVVNRKTYVISSHSQGGPTTKSPRTKARPVEREPESAEEGHCDGDPAGRGDPEGVRESLKRLIMEERPPWEALDGCFPDWDVPSDSPAPSPLSKPSPAKVSVYQEQSDRSTESSPAGRALKSLTNNVPTLSAESEGRVRRRGAAAVSYKEPAINR